MNYHSGILNFSPNFSNNSGIGDATGMILDDPAEKLAIKFIAHSTSPITHVSVLLNIVGTVTGINFQIGIFANESDAPDDATQLGGWTADWAGLAADGFTGDKQLSTNTGDLEINTCYWVVIRQNTTGGNVDGSNYIQLKGWNSGFLLLQPARARHFNGTNWTTTTVGTNLVGMVITQSSGALAGNPFTGAGQASTSTDIYKSGSNYNVQGIKYVCGVDHYIAGFLLNLSKTGTPESLKITIYEGSTQIGQATVPQGSISSSFVFCCFLTTPCLVHKDTTIYIILSQEGTSDSNDYDTKTAPIVSGTIDLCLPPNVRFVSGAMTTDPTGLTVSTTQIPVFIQALLADIEVDLDCAGGGGGLIRHPGMNGGLNG